MPQWWNDTASSFLISIAAGIALSVVSLIVGAWWGTRRARSEWSSKRFSNRLNVSLNVMQEGMLKIRTILERSHEEVFLNDIAVKTVLEASAQTTEQEPLLPLKEDDNWYLLNAVLNQISERVAGGDFRRDLGLPVTTEKYLICLTNECEGAVRTRKVRALLIKRDSLLNLPDALPELENPNHVTRYHTLRFMAEAYATQPHRFMQLEVSI